MIAMNDEATDVDEITDDLGKVLMRWLRVETITGKEVIRSCQDSVRTRLLLTHQDN